MIRLALYAFALTLMFAPMALAVVVAGVYWCVFYLPLLLAWKLARLAFR